MDLNTGGLSKHDGVYDNERSRACERRRERTGAHVRAYARLGVFAQFRQCTCGLDASLSGKQVGIQSGAERTCNKERQAAVIDTHAL